MRKMPIIISDIDGVLLHNNKAIAKALRTLKILRYPLYKIDPTNFRDIHSQIPLVFLTNNCIENQLEYEKAHYLNTVFEL
jgi:ribonucleotide monophosphatase NagD (HAD superfamily)